MADNESFTQTLDELVEDHSDNVPVLAKGEIAFRILAMN